MAHAAVIGGHVAEAGTFPWMAYILDVRGEEVGQCSGTIVAPRLVLTAGHCGEDVETGVLNEALGYRVVTGNVDWADEADRQVSDVSKVIIYPGFDRSTLTGDAALLELSTPTSAPPIALATNLGGMPAGTGALIAGWGKTFPEQEYFTERLRWADTAVQGPNYCDENAPPFYAQDELCAIDPPSYSTGTCFGDSGGPLLAEWPEGRGVAEIGITSQVYGECSTSKPDVFTRSDLVASWIKDWAQRIQSEEEAAAIKRHKEEVATRRRQEEEAAAKTRHEEEVAADTKRRQEEESREAAAKRRQDEEAAAKKRREEEAAVARRRQEGEGGVFRGTTGQSGNSITLVLARGGKRITGLATTLVYHCRGGAAIHESFDVLSNREPELVKADHSFRGAFSGNPRQTISGHFDLAAGTVAGSVTGTYKTPRYGRCSTGRVTWNARRQAAVASTEALAAAGSYRGWVNGQTRIDVGIGAGGRTLTGLQFSAVYHCPRGRKLRLSEQFWSARDAQALEFLGTFTYYMRGPHRYSGRMDGAFGLVSGSAFGTLEASVGSRYGRCSTGLVYWEASMSRSSRGDGSVARRAL